MYPLWNTIQLCINLPFKWLHTGQEIGDGRNLDVLLNSTMKFVLAVSEVIIALSITVFSLSEATRNWYDVRQEELQSPVQNSSQAG